MHECFGAESGCLTRTVLADLQSADTNVTFIGFNLVISCFQKTATAAVSVGHLKSKHSQDFQRRQHVEDTIGDAGDVVPDQQPFGK